MGMNFQSLVGGGKDVQVILASGSPRRADILRRYFPDLLVKPSPFAEDHNPYNFSNAQFYAEHNAKTKMEYALKSPDIAEFKGDYVLITSDTVVAIDKNGQSPGFAVFEKPATMAESERMIYELLEGGSHQVISAVSIYSSRSRCARTFAETTSVHMQQNIPSALVQSYVESQEGMDKAGAYGYQGGAAFLIRRIEGCYYNVVGLPISRLLRELQTTPIV